MRFLVWDDPEIRGPIFKALGRGLLTERKIRVNDEEKENKQHLALRQQLLDG